MKSTRFILSSLAAAVFVGVANATQSLALGGIADGATSARGADQPIDLFGETGVFAQITTILLFIIGAVAVIMLIIGGLRYVVSAGDASKVQEAKNTILYALVGIVVAILAYAAVNFVISTFLPGSSSQPGGRATSTYGTSTR